MLRLPTAAMHKKEPPEHGGLIRLPSGATRRGLPCRTSTGDEPLSPPVSDEDEAEKLARGRASVQRNRFFLKHASSAEFLGTYEVEQHTLGEGGFGTVHRARLRGSDNILRAVKFINKRKVKSDHSVLKEATILRRLDHPHICRLIETFEGSKNVYLVMEYVDGKELFDYIQEAFAKTYELDEFFASTIMRQVFGALHYCHQHSVIHMDLKPENVMVVKSQNRKGVEDVQVKLIDFGLAMICKPGIPPRKSMMGTYDYLAPEVRNGAATTASDMWSAGCVLHALLLGTLPPESVRFGVEALDIADPMFLGVSAPAKALLRKLLQADPKQRIAAGAAAACQWTKGVIETHPNHFRQLNKTMVAFLAFHRSTLLRRAVLTALAMQIGSQQLVDLQKQFLRLDLDGNGRISREELAHSINLNDPDLTGEAQHWFESIFDSVDTDGSKEIEYTEYVAAALIEAGSQAEQAMRAAFRVFDTDGSGKISMQEFARVVVQSRDDIANFFNVHDLDGDGELNFREFRAMIQTSPIMMKTATHKSLKSASSGKTLNSDVMTSRLSSDRTSSHHATGAAEKVPQWFRLAKMVFSGQKVG